MADPDSTSTEPPDLEWRDSQRTAVDFPIHLRVRRARIPGRLVEVSHTGIRMITRTSQSVGEPCGLELRHQGQEELFQVIPRWDCYFDDRFMTGAELLGDEADRARWKALTARLPEASDPAARAESFEQRVARRIVSRRPILYLDRNHWIKGTLQNVSEGGSGALMTVRAHHPPGAVVNFRIRVEGNSYEFHAQTVRSAFMDGTYQVAVRFVKPLPASVAAAAPEEDAAAPEKDAAAPVKDAAAPEEDAAAPAANSTGSEGTTEDA